VLFSASKVVTSGSKLLFPAIVLLGAYVFIHGHLSPGGGFQGGVIIATGFLLMLLAYENFTVGHNALSVIESLAGITFAGVGIWGLIYGGSFLENFLPVGTLNDLFSGGVIPIIYIAVGFKVAAELTGVIYTVLHEKG
jgi:multicomponent Na+:H+ antiporter subunit B